METEVWFAEGGQEEDVEIWWRRAGEGEGEAEVLEDVDGEVGVALADGAGVAAADLDVEVCVGSDDAQDDSGSSSSSDEEDSCSSSSSGVDDDDELVLSGDGSDEGSGVEVLVSSEDQWETDDGEADNSSSSDGEELEDPLVLNSDSDDEAAAEGEEGEEQEGQGNGEGGPLKVWRPHRSSILAVDGETENQQLAKLVWDVAGSRAVREGWQLRIPTASAAQEGAPHPPPPHFSSRRVWFEGGNMLIDERIKSDGFDPMNQDSDSSSSSEDEDEGEEGQDSQGGSRSSGKEEEEDQQRRNSGSNTSSSGRGDEGGAVEDPAAADVDGDFGEVELGIDAEIWAQLSRRMVKSHEVSAWREAQREKQARSTPWYDQQPPVETEQPAEEVKGAKGRGGGMKWEERFASRGGTIYLFLHDVLNEGTGGKESQTAGA